MQEDHKFKAGDLVQLKSGGPEMTVEKVSSLPGDESPSYICTWFTEQYSKVNREDFSENALKKYEQLALDAEQIRIITELSL